MRLQVVEIGNSKGIRIPQAILKQVNFEKEVDLDVSEGKIVLRKLVDPDKVLEFETIAKMDDESIKRVLRKINMTDLLIALVDADKHTKDAIYRNLAEKTKKHIKAKVLKLEKGNVRDLMVERSRNMISEAFGDMVRE